MPVTRIAQTATIRELSVGLHSPTANCVPQDQLVERRQDRAEPTIKIWASSPAFQ